MTKETATNLLQRYLAEVKAGHAIDPVWSLEAEDGGGNTTYDALACERLAADAPTDFLAGLWLGRSLVLRELNQLQDGSG